MLRWRTHVIPAVGGLRQEDCLEFQISLGYIVSNVTAAKKCSGNKEKLIGLEEAFYLNPEEISPKEIFLAAGECRGVCSPSPPPRDCRCAALEEQNLSRGHSGLGKANKRAAPAHCASGFFAEGLACCATLFFGPCEWAAAKADRRRGHSLEAKLWFAKSNPENCNEKGQVAGTLNSETENATVMTSGSIPSLFG